MEASTSAQCDSAVAIVAEFRKAVDCGDQDGIIELGGKLLRNLDPFGQQKDTFEAVARMQIGRVRSDRREFEVAEEMFRRGAEAASRRGPTTLGANILNDLAIMYRKQGKWRLAEGAYHQAIRAWPPDQGAWCGEFWFSLGEVQERQGKAEHAYFSYREAISRPCPLPEERNFGEGQGAHRVCDGTVHSWLPLAIFRMVRCGASQATGGDWLAFWGRSRGRRWGAGLVFLAMTFFWIATFARFLGVAIPISLGGASFVIPSQATPAWAFLILGAMPLGVLILHQLRGVGTQGVQLEQDQPIFPAIGEDELALPRRGQWSAGLSVSRRQSEALSCRRAGQGHLASAVEGLRPSPLLVAAVALRFGGGSGGVGGFGQQFHVAGLVRAALVSGLKPGSTEGVASAGRTPITA